MKKTLLRLKLKLLITPQSSLSKTLLFMKMTVLLILLTTLQAVAGDANAQIVTIQMNQVFMPTVFKAIEKQSEFRFLYNYDLAALQKKVNVNLEGKTVPTLLDNILLGTGLIYKLLENNLIVIIPSENSEFFEDRKITGTIKDAAGKAVSSASVYIKNKSTGTTTNASGQFTIIGEVGQTIVIQAVNYETLEVIISNQKSFDFVLKSSISNLEEVIVVGYGSMKKSDLTGSVARANLEIFQEQPSISIIQSLQGVIPGVNVGITTLAGQDPSILIRGEKTISGTSSPLIVLDGIIYRGSLVDLNKDDVESIDVLKDASSAAIYGSQAANGVILITTKKGTSSVKPMINYSSYYSVGTPTNTNLTFFNKDKYLTKVRDFYWKDAYLAPNYTAINPGWDPNNYFQDAIVKNGYAKGIVTDWANVLTQSPRIINHNLSITGKNNNTSYFISTGYSKQEELVINDNFSKWNVRINLENKINDWLAIGAQTFFSSDDYSGRSPNYGLAYLFSPAVAYKTENGDLIRDMQSPYTNPLQAKDIDDFDKRINLFANFNATVDIPFVKGLKYKLNYSHNYRTRRYFMYDSWGNSNTGAAVKDYSTDYDQTIDNIISYDRTYNDIHKVSATFVYGMETRENEFTDASSGEFSSFGLSYNSLEGGSIAKQLTSSDAWKENSLYSMSRLFYGYNNKYLATLTIRRDGFSGFGTNKKFGVFPTAAVAWVLSQESFIKQINWISNLKLRTSYGQTGNRTVTRYSTLAKVIKTKTYSYGNGASPEEGQYISSLANNDLGWETTTGLNFGIDFGFLDNRIRGNLEYYNTKTKDVLYAVGIPILTGFSSSLTNIGQINNHGVEMTISSTNIKRNGFEWNSDFSFSLARDKVITILGIDANGDGKEDDLVSSGIFIGKPLRTNYDYTYSGIYQIGDKIPSGYYAGSYKIVDLDKDGVITPKDRSITGYRQPAYSFSINNEFRYKEWSLFVFLNAIQGGKNRYMQSNSPYQNGAFQAGGANWNIPNQWDYWSPSNPNAEYPAIYNPAAITPATYRDRSFVRLQNVSLSYSFNRKILDKLKLSNLKLYVSGKNLYTWTKWKGWDPEAGYGLTVGGTPITANYTIGLNLSF